MPILLAKPYWVSPDGKTAKLWLGDVRESLRGLPAKSVQCAVTSPPYWGLRSYLKEDDVSKSSEIGSEPSPDCGTLGQAQCGQCFICTMVEMFREVSRVLRDDGVLWCNLGDTYASNNGTGFDTNQDGGHRKSQYAGQTAKSPLKSGNLIGIPWRVALALQAGGWVLRQDIIWSKASPMPEPVKSRCTKSHEYIFLLTKSMDYYYDADAIKEPLKAPAHAPSNNKLDKSRNDRGSMNNVWGAQGYANKRSVWHLTTEPTTGQHYASYPKKLVEPCILAGTSARGACIKCGSPWERLVDDKPIVRERPNELTKRTHAVGTGNACPNTIGGISSMTVGWYPTCKCDRLPELPKEPPAGKDYNASKRVDGTEKVTGISRDRDDDDDRINGVRSEAYDNYIKEVTRLCEMSKDIPTIPCVVLDPFLGSGTTGVVAMQHGRYAWGIELSKNYCDLHIIPRFNRVCGFKMAESKSFRELNNKLNNKLVQKSKLPTKRKSS